jgi:hypothetical protein
VQLQRLRKNIENKINFHFYAEKKFAEFLCLCLYMKTRLYSSSERETNTSIINNMAYPLTPESECSPTNDLSWTQLLTDKPKTLKPTIVRIEEKPKELNPEEEQLNVPSGGENGRRNQRERRESLIGTFNRHLRQSLKAVSESPGPLTR